jgi:hypothetical protein
MARLRKMVYGGQGITMNLLRNEPGVVKLIKVGRLRWLGYLFTVQEQNPCRNIILHKPEGIIRRVGRPALRWLGTSEDDLKKMDVINWRRQ